MSVEEKKTIKSGGAAATDVAKRLTWSMKETRSNGSLTCPPVVVVPAEVSWYDAIDMVPDRRFRSACAGDGLRLHTDSGEDDRSTARNKPEGKQQSIGDGAKNGLLVVRD